MNSSTMAPCWSAGSKMNHRARKSRGALIERHGYHCGEGRGFRPKIGVDRGGRCQLLYPALGIPDRKFMSTFFAKKEEQKPRWYIIDADKQVLGKVAVRAANVLRGKIKPTFTSHVHARALVVVSNA